MVRATTKMCETCKFSYLLSNGVIAKIILCDLDLLFEGQNFKIISLKW